MYSLAERVGVDKGHLSRIDKGNGGCSLKIAAAIEKATRFGVTMADIARIQEKAEP